MTVGNPKGLHDDPGRLSLPRAMPGSSVTDSRPDLVMVSGKRNTPPASRRVDLLELKYCRDTDPTAQTTRAEAQHARLVERLLRQGYRRHKIHYHTIVLGVSGTIYKSMYPVLRALGVQKTASHRLAGKLHQLAAQ